MKKNTLFLFALLCLTLPLTAQEEPGAGSWKTWLIPSVREYRLAAPKPSKEEIKAVLKAQQQIDADMQQKILFWNAGSPGYRWQQLMADNWMSDSRQNGVWANALLDICIYDATIAAWDSKYRYNRPRPFKASQAVRTFAPQPQSPSYPCEHSVAAGVAVAIFSHYFPALADSVSRMAAAAMQSRIAAGLVYPSDTKAGFELGRKIAEKEIELSKGFLNNTAWDGKTPDKPGLWKGAFAMLPHAGQSKTIALTSGDQFRPGPPPDYAKEMEELKSYKQTTKSMGNALEFNNQPVWEDMLDKKIFEYNLHLNPPAAARIYAARAIGFYDGFIACWDAKYAYWGIRPEQYDPEFKPLLVKSPPFPGYPSGHAAIGSVMSVLYAYFFPAEKTYFEKRAKDGAESRFQGGIHFRSDNDVALILGRKVAEAIIERLEKDGVGGINWR